MCVCDWKKLFVTYFWNSMQETSMIKGIEQLLDLDVTLAKEVHHAEVGHQGVTKDVQVRSQLL